MEGTVGFIRMDEGTYEDYQLLNTHWERHQAALADEVLAMLKRLGGDKMGYQIDRFQHSLQTATRAKRDAADDETVCCALLHDIGDILAPQNHAQLAAAVLRPYISEDNYWLIKHHAIFQGYFFWHHYGQDRNARDRYRGHPMFQRTADFCGKWDQTSFDPDYDTMPLEAFEPMVRRLFERPREGFSV